MIMKLGSLLFLVWWTHGAWAAEYDAFPSLWSWNMVSGINYLTRLQNEHSPKYCRGSWVFATTSALSSRLKIAAKAPEQIVVLSAQVILNCSPGNCSGAGDPRTVYKYIEQHGVPDETCQNYEGEENTCNAQGICRDCKRDQKQHPKWVCWAVKDYNRYGLESHGELKGEDFSGEGMVDAIKKEILENGPITCAVHPSTDFIHYKKGVLKHDDSSENAEVHYVNIIGWRHTRTKKVWIGENSWGEYWGVGGLFLLEMGTNALGVETHCTFGKVKLMPSKPPTTTTFLDKKERDFKSCGCIKQPKNFRFRQSFSTDVTNVKVPNSYDIRNLDGVNYATIDKNQHIPQYCGSCWAFAPSSALADRFSLLYDGSLTALFDLSTQVLISCVSWSFGCNGGWPAYTYHYILNYGVPHESCSPYRSFAENCKAINICRKCTSKSLPCTAINSTEYLLFTISKHGQIAGKKNIKKEIVAGGPISCLMGTTDDFHNYKGGIINDTTLIRQMDHVVEVAGWGEENGIEYWIIRNSWGTYWGENGWARVAMGVGDFGLASFYCDWAKPELLHHSYIHYQQQQQTNLESLFQQQQQHQQPHLET